MKNINQSSKEKKQEEKLTPRELVNKLLQDPQHTISDEEIKNLKTGREAETKSVREKKIANKLDELKKNPGSKKLINPYDILDP
ncbi:MAG: hypothetical protein M3Z26_14730 [Bacteroidota bacterium]|nr:hypothetical protein [Bacteroidota bacterium]